MGYFDDTPDIISTGLGSGAARRREQRLINEYERQITSLQKQLSKLRSDRKELAELCYSTFDQRNAWVNVLRNLWERYDIDLTCDEINAMHDKEVDAARKKREAAQAQHNSGPSL